MTMNTITNTARTAAVALVAAAALLTATPAGATDDTTDPCAPYIARLDNISGRYSALLVEVTTLRGEVTTTAANLALAREQSAGLASDLAYERGRVARLKATIARLRANR